MPDFASQLLIYQSNVVDSLLEPLTQQLGVSAESLLALEIGYALRVPLKDDKEFRDGWVFPERNERGDIIGLMLRFWNGEKRMIPESNRGLIFIPGRYKNSLTSKYVVGPQNWQRVSDDCVCPICSKSDACMVSSENPGDPKAVMCCRVSTNAVKELGAGFYLHIRKSEGDLTQTASVLPLSEYPILIVEGASDVAAARDIGFVTVGRSNATGNLDTLARLVGGRDLVVCGENDSGAGKDGMEQTYEVVKRIAKSVIKIMPPEGIKDLRDWKIQGLTKEQLLGYIQVNGDQTSTTTVLESIAPLDLARTWLDAQFRRGEVYTLRQLHGNWFAFTGNCYEELEKPVVRKSLYEFFGDKKYKKILAKGFEIVDYEPTKFKIDQILDAALTFCTTPISAIPCWLVHTESRPDPKRILVFPNGYLDVKEYLQNDYRLSTVTPELFTLAHFPYDFDQTATCLQWIQFLEEIFKDDPAKIQLLQEWFGYNLIPDNSFEKFMLLLGPPRAGKGTILEVLAAVLGEHQVVATTFRDYTRRFGFFPFVGKLAAVVGDVSVGVNYDATEALNILKRITGNDPISVEQKGRDITQACVHLHTRFTMAANAMPRLPDFVRAIESRILIVQFLLTFAGREDYGLKDRLKIEAPGILIWSLKGFKRLKENGTFTLPVQHESMLRRIRSELTPFVEFVDDCCVFGRGGEFFISVDRLYECWKMWAVKNGETHHSVRWMLKVLTNLYPSCRIERRTSNAGQRIKGVTGFKLNTEYLMEFGE